MQLNKPKTLNALIYSMEWELDKKETELIIIKSTESKAFSADGNIKILPMTSSISENIRTDYFRDEYQLIYVIGTYKLPLFPNADGSYFLPRLSNNLRVFLGLTGRRLRGIDIVHAGIATHFFPIN
ncbi:unnamed protein product [Rotaria sp. Silwood2]|nr:unnamed protein product [Rotaria sp. Silwood2]